MPNPIAIQNRTIRILFLLSVGFMMIGVTCFSVYVLSLRRKTTKFYLFDTASYKPPYPETFEEVQYTDNIKPSLLVASIVMIMVSVFCIVYIFSKFVSVFANSPRPIINYLLLVLIVLTNILILGCNSWYLFIRPPAPLPNNVCPNPLQYRDVIDGKCHCVGDLTESPGGGCVCEDNKHQQTKDSWNCTNVCYSDDQCLKDQFCNLNSNMCCNNSQVKCGRTCCDPSLQCINNEECCDPTQVCQTTQGTVCCSPDKTCQDGQCVVKCGNKLRCKDHEQCFTLTGTYDSVNEYAKTLSDKGNVKAEDIEVDENIDGTGQLSYCSSPTLCQFMAEPQYFPTVLKSRGPFLNFYPCLVSTKLTPLAKLPEKEMSKYPTPYDLNVCTPKAPDDPTHIQDFGELYKKCFERIRPHNKPPLDASKCVIDGDADECQLMNIMHTDYSNPSLQDTLYRTIVTNTIDTGGPGSPNYRAYQGSFCGPNSYRMINNTVSNSCTDADAALACAQLGAYNDSKYISYGVVNNKDGTKRRYCNTYFSCPDLSDEKQSELKKDPSRGYFHSYNFGNITKSFQPLYNDAPPSGANSDLDNQDVNTHYVYKIHCPTLDPIDSNYWHGCTGSECVFKDCPDNLKYIQSKCQVVNGAGYCDTNLCLDAGYVYRMSEQEGGNYYVIRFDRKFPDDFRQIGIFPNGACKPDPSSGRITNCFTYAQYAQLLYDYKFSMPLPPEVQAMIINSDGIKPWNLYRPTFDVKCNNFSSKEGGIIGKTQLQIGGGESCKWSARMGINVHNCNVLPEHANKIMFVKVRVDKNLRVSPVLDPQNTIRDKDYVIILGDDGYRSNFTGLGTSCNGEYAPCFRKENAYIPAKTDPATGYAVPDWDNMDDDHAIVFNNAVWIIDIHDDPYIYEELLSSEDNPIKYLRTERCFSLRKPPGTGQFQDMYLELNPDDPASVQSCRACVGTMCPFRMSKKSVTTDSDFMTHYTFLLSNTPDVVRPMDERSQNKDQGSEFL